MQIRENIEYLSSKPYKQTQCYCVLHKQTSIKNNWHKQTSTKNIGTNKLQ